MGSGDEMMRKHPPQPPTGWERLKWYGPGLLWMLSSVGSGSVLFTPRVGSRYGYELLWAALIVIFLQWAMIHEVGRYTVATGRTLLEGYDRLPGPRKWAIWFIFVPQLVEAVVTIAGIAALAGSALMIALPGSQALYAIGLIVVSIVLVVTGQYKGVERVSAILAGVLMAAAISAAVMVLPSPGNLGAGLAPTLPQPLDLYFILPWLGFILAGAAGVIWFSYWVATRGYGGPVLAAQSVAERDRQSDLPWEERLARLRQWNRVMRNTALIGVIGGGLVVLSFLILGAEVLRPEGVVPEGIRVAEDLTRLLSEVWGAWGKWILLLGIFIALWGTILADQDGWGRLFADATALLWPRKFSAGSGGLNGSRHDREPQGFWPKLAGSRERLKNTYAVVATALLPLAIFLFVRNPVDLLSIGGIIAAAHTPVIVFLTLYLNKKQLPRELQPGRIMFACVAFAGLFFLFFAVLYLLNLAGIKLFENAGGAG